MVYLPLVYTLSVIILFISYTFLTWLFWLDFWRLNYDLRWWTIGIHEKIWPINGPFLKFEIINQSVSLNKMRVRGISIQALIVVRIECPADASFVVVDSEDAETCEPGGDLALIIGVPVPVKTHWIVACAVRSKWFHGRASSIFFFWEAKVCQKTLIVAHS